MTQKSENYLRQLPQNIDAEQALLASIFVNNRAIERVSDFLLPEHFSKIILQVMENLKK